LDTRFRGYDEFKVFGESPEDNPNLKLGMDWPARSQEKRLGFGCSKWPVQNGRSAGGTVRWMA
jgi:hypothetical protein